MTSMSKRLRIGSGAGFSGDRLEPAVLLAERADIDFLVLECLGERTVALAQLRKRRDPAAALIRCFGDASNHCCQH